MDSDSDKSETVPVEVVFENIVDESSEEPPREEWSSLELSVDDYNPKRILYEQGKYDPGEGDICDHYFTLSASSVFRHPYYQYPAIVDPGILNALQKPVEPVIFPDDGQELYLNICQEMKLCPVRSFYKGLVESDIGLMYYGVNPRGVRAMAMALNYNTIVKSLRLTDNFLTDDACYHLGEMLLSNCSLTKLDISGCRIGPSGAQMLLTPMVSNKVLKTLNLSGNELGDAGMEHLAEAVFRGLGINDIDLSHNNINGRGLTSLATAFETFNNITHLNLSWNNLYSQGTYNFLVSLSQTTKNLQEIDLSWNSLSGIRVAQGIRKLLTIQTLNYLNLSNNKLEGAAISTVVSFLPKAKNLITLNLSYNPMKPNDALAVLQKLMMPNVNVCQVFMDNVSVDKLFLEFLLEIKEEKPKLIITYGNVRGTFVPIGPSLKDLVLDRVDYLCQKPKKNQIDIALVFLQLHKDKTYRLTDKEFIKMLRSSGIRLDMDLVEEMIITFPGPRTDKGKTVDINLIVEYIKRKWPDRKLPPTPPPEPEPERKPKKKGKGKGKAKSKK